jgi:hypothetical protein
MAALGRKLFKQGIDHVKSKEFREYLMRYVRNELIRVRNLAGYTHMYKCVGIRKMGIKLLKISDISAFKGVIPCSLADTVLWRNLLPPSSGWQQLNVVSYRGS